MKALSCAGSLTPGSGRRPWGTLLPTLALLLLTSPSAPAAVAPPVLQAPTRPADAITGSDFADRTRQLSSRDRQLVAIAELEQGNLPDSLRTFLPVRLTSEHAPGRVAVVWVMPDYLAVGSDADFLRVPLGYPSARSIAARFDAVLPTRRIVDAVYEQATCRLKPQPLPAGPRMRSSGYLLRHRSLIERQRSRCPAGALTAGLKKDVVISNRLHEKRLERVAIYGWHRSKRRPIQELSTVHGARYADYSHGVRLVHETVWIDGEPRSLLDALGDPAVASLLSDEGVIHDARRLMEP